MPLLTYVKEFGTLALVAQINGTMFVHSQYENIVTKAECVIGLCDFGVYICTEKDLICNFNSHQED